MSTIIKYVSIAIVLLLAASIGLAKKIPAKLASFDRQVRVHLGQFDTLTVSSTGEFVIESFRGGRRADIYYTSSTIKVTRDYQGISIGDDNGFLAIKLSSLLFRPRFPNVFIDLPGHRYRGTIECTAADSSGNFDTLKTITVYNLVDIEDYLKGVLPGELGPRANDEYEAVKAQAITARTYAIWRLTSDGSPNQLKNTIEDQLYLGAGAEMPLHSRAVEETKGMIMLAEGKPVAAYYHAVCGGSTAPREKVWGGEKVSYLRGVDDDGYCQWAKSYSWKENFTYDDLNNNINQYISALGIVPARGFGKIIDIGFKLDKTIERMSEMKVITTTGEYSVFSDKIRWALKRPSVPGAILPSTRFSAKIISDGGAIAGLELEGTGNGHGVGMCQCGAIGRARKGVRYSDILKTYYRGIKIEKLY